jgi:hypothetical protein
LKSLIDDSALTSLFVKEVQDEIRSKGLLDELETRLLQSQDIAPRPKRHRAKRPWRPNERQQAILDLPAPGQMPLETYCKALDAANVPIRPKWQKGGKPATHLQAWATGKKLRDYVRNEREYVWKKCRKG